MNYIERLEKDLKELKVKVIKIEDEGVVMNIETDKVKYMLFMQSDRLLLSGDGQFIAITSLDNFSEMLLELRDHYDAQKKK